MLLAGSAAAQDLPALPPPPPPPPPPSAPPSATSSPLPATPRSQPASGPRVDVRFEPDEPGLEVYRLGGVTPVERIVPGYWGWWYERGYAPVYAPVCVAPCSASMVPGAYRLALGKPGGRAVPASQPVVLDEPSVVHGHYTDRSGLRAAGLVVGIAGTVGGIVMIVASADGTETVCDVDGNCFDRTRVNGPLLAGGIGVIVVSVIVGTLLGLQHDGAQLTVEPLRAQSVGVGSAPAMDRLASLSSLEGAALTLRF